VTQVLGERGTQKGRESSTPESYYSFGGENEGKGKKRRVLKNRYKEILRRRDLDDPGKKDEKFSYVQLRGGARSREGGASPLHVRRISLREEERGRHLRSTLPGDLGHGDS